MDVQKVSPLANALANSKAQNSGDILGGVSKLASSFSSLIRGPVAEHSSLFSETEKNIHPASQAVETPKKSNNPERNDSDDNNYRADDVNRADNARDEKNDASASNKADNDAHKDNADNRDNNRDDHNDQPADKDDTVKQATDDNQETASDENTETNEQSTSNSDSNEASSAEENSTSAVDNDETAVGMAQGSDADGFDAAIEGLLVAAHSTNTETTVKEAVQNLTNIVNGNAGTPSENAIGPVSNKPTDIASQNASENAGNKEQFLTPKGTPEQVINNDQIQKVLRAVARLGVGTEPKDIVQAAKSADVSLSENQARLLSDALKSDRPVNINVTVNRSAEGSISQTSQSLTSNAVAAQAMEMGTASTSDINANQARAIGPQIANAAVESQGMAHGQTQAAATLANTPAATAGESGIARGVTQSMGSATQTNVDAPNATAQNNTTQLQASNVTKPALVQAQQSPEHNRPITHQISVNITKAIAQGLDKISIQLRPDNLGRVEVQLEVSNTGKVNATIIADRPEAIELLRNDARNLERALQDAGLDAKADDIKFSLRDQDKDSGEPQADSEMAEEEEVEEIEMLDGTLEAELATRILNGELDQIVSNSRVDINA